MGATADTDVLVVGAGPCGATLANLLGVYGARCVVIDRETEIPDYPRAVGIDDESLRTYQAVGLVDRILADVIQNTPIRYHTSWGRCFAHVKPSAQPFGWPRRNLFLQPLFEAVLRSGLERFDTVEARYGHELVSVAQDGDGVTAEVKTPDGATSPVRARFLVGADGGRSTVRQLAGVELTGKTAPVKWLVVDVAGDQLDAPYSAVYCDPTRPVLVVPLPYRHRRFEFKLLPGDDEEEMTRPERVMSLLAPRYGSLPLPTIVRSRVYLHHSRIAERFAVGRVFLAGDAAHLQPPFFGQGMNSGVRDATNLAWKLAAVASGRAGEGILGSYDAERRDHAAAMVGFATRIGRMYSPRSRATERVRDVGFRALQLVPGGKEYVLQMKYKPMPRYTSGIVVGARRSRRDDPVGRMFLQRAVESAGGRRERLDDVLGPWFAVIGIHLDPTVHLGASSLSWWSTLGARFVEVRPSRSGARPGALSGEVQAPDGAAGLVDPAAPACAAPAAPAVPSAPAAPSATAAPTVVEDVDGAFRDWLLEHPGDEVVVLRPDRYVAAVCDRAGFEHTTEALRGLLAEAGAPS
jgi:3-(3-hydroxy-phenyl)propionate hydroxylase